MIRPYRTQDLEPILTLWLDASIRAHDFLDRSYWESKLDDMREIYLPASQTWVYEREGCVEGFVSLFNDVLAAIFVSPACQGRGIGSLLIEHAKTQRERLHLTVYSANLPSVGFYRRHGFDVLGEQLDEHTGHPELVMAWCIDGSFQTPAEVGMASASS